MKYSAQANQIGPDGEIIDVLHLGDHKGFVGAMQDARRFARLVGADVVDGMPLDERDPSGMTHVYAKSSDGTMEVELISWRFE